MELEDYFLLIYHRARIGLLTKLSKLSHPSDPERIDGSLGGWHVQPRICIGCGRIILGCLREEWLFIHSTLGHIHWIQ